ncbi:hypothetical protein [Paraburkholderia sp. GAS32]|uniref:hypothetical protein n=1 Tax=Paraburkholderia sp. GAS32 TaxID=3035129 RepID=UPI003D1E3B40
MIYEAQPTPATVATFAPTPAADAPKTAGNFVLIENKKTHWFEPTPHAWDLEQGATHRLILSHGESRPLRLLKTVAYVAVDEAADGTAVWEKWLIRDLRAWEHKH